MLAPDAAADKQARIKQLAQRITVLAQDAEQGSRSYSEFEIVLAGLQAEGKFPDRSAVSTVAEAFLEIAV
jgi:hypothetical protein